MNALTEWQHSNNAQSRDAWNSFSGHRKRVTDLLQPDSPFRGGRICILGAGNCNDLDLLALLDAYGEVHLVDLDADALALGVARQGVGSRDGLRLWGGIDLTGMIDSIAAWSPKTAIAPEDLSACLEGPVRQVAPSLAGPFDFVASTCLLSQLIRGIVASAGELHPRFLESVQAIRAGHLRLLAHLLSPRGTAALITDVVSSETYPTLGSVLEDSLGDLINRLVRDRNYFHGLNPLILASLVTSDPVLKTEGISQELISPWRWDLGPRLYLVCALKYRKKPSPSP